MQYEFVIVVDTKEEDKKAQERLTAFFIKEGFSVSGVESLGKRMLAYPIKKRTEGLHLIFNLSGSKNPTTTEIKLKQDEMVLRTMVLKKE